MFELGKKEGMDGLSDESSQPASTPSRSASDRQAPSMSSAGRGVAAIGRSIRINGDLEGEEDLRIEGEVNGTVRLKNNAVTVGRDGKIRADVYAKSVAVEGSVEGDLFGAEQVAIRQSAEVKGNVTAPRVSLEDGARFKGSIEMDPEAVKSALGDAAVSSSSGKSSRSNKPTPISKPKPNGADISEDAPVQAAKS